MSKETEFIKRKEAFQEGDLDVNAKIDYLIKQVHTLFDMMTTSKSKKKKSANKNVDIEKIVVEELEAYGLKLEWAGCTYIIELVKQAKSLGLTTESDYDTICKSIISDSNLFKRSITFIRKKAKFENAKYLTNLAKMDKSQITNEIILKSFIGLCY